MLHAGAEGVLRGAEPHYTTANAMSSRHTCISAQVLATAQLSGTHEGRATAVGISLGPNGCCDMLLAPLDPMLLMLLMSKRWGLDERTLMHGDITL